MSRFLRKTHFFGLFGKSWKMAKTGGTFPQFLLKRWALIREQNSLIKILDARIFLEWGRERWQAVSGRALYTNIGELTYCLYLYWYYDVACPILLCQPRCTWMIALPDSTRWLHLMMKYLKWVIAFKRESLTTLWCRAMIHQLILKYKK